MMLLSRFWYAVLGLFCAAALYVAYLAVGQYNRRNAVAASELIASDSQTVGWALQIDGRRRLDALLVGAVDKGVQDALIATNGKDLVPPNARGGARKALTSVLEKIPVEYRGDAIFAVDREGRVVGQVGYDVAQAFDDFELGGYAAVNDALHGYLRDDTWILGGRIYRVVARPVEYDVTQAPVGAIVALRLVDAKFAQELARRTRANVAFFSGGQRVASAAGSEGFDESSFELVTSDLAKIDTDKSFKDSGRSEVRPLSAAMGGMYTRLIGEAWDMGAGYVVLRARVAITGPMGFLSGADDKDKSAVPMGLIVLLALLGIGVGFGLSYVEHTLPLKMFEAQALDLRAGKQDLLQLARFRGPYLVIAQDLNAGVERVAEKGGGAPRKAADLEQILGPTPAQPAMSAFAFPQDGLSSVSSSQPSLGHSGLNRLPPTPSGGGPALPRPPTAPSFGGGSGSGPKAFVPPPKPPPVRPVPTSSLPVASLSLPPMADDEDDEATMVAAVPKEVLAAATGEHRALAAEENAEWLSVYEDFVRTKRQCGEPTDGLTFEKFQHTLRKNRDALIARHGCRRVKFSVYVKEGKASLKATPVKD